MQDTCSEVNVPAASHPEPELIISCHRDQRDQCHRNNLQRESKVITRSQSSASTAPHAPVHQLKQQQSLPTPLTQQPSHNPHHNPQTPKSVSILVYKTLNTVFKSSRKIIVRVCEVASAKKSFTMFKFNKAAQQQRIDNRNSAVTGHDPFVRPPVPEKKVRNIMKKLHKANGLKRSNSAIEFDVSALTAANRRQIYSRPNIKYQYSALDSGNGIVERSPRERAQREKALNATQEWIQGANGRYEVIAHLDEIGSRHGKNWFLVTDASVRTDRLQTLLPLPPDCVAFEDLPPNECAREILMELLGSLHHPYIYPVLDLGFLRNNSYNYACLVTPFNSRGSLKDLIYKAQWNEPWARKYTRKPNGLPVSQVQRLGRQILEALLFLRERGFPLHGHLHSGNVILQNGAARLSGLENGLLGLSSRINAVMWSRSVTEIENVDIVCFGHLLYEMCTGQELTTPKPSMRVLEMELQHYPQIGQTRKQILEILGLIFEPPSGVCPSVEDLVLCDLFRSIDLRELRGPCFSTIKPSLSRSTLNLLQAVKKRQCASLGHSLSEANSPCTPPSTPHDRRTGISRTMDSFDISSDSEEGLLEEIVVGGSCHRQHLLRLQQWHSAHSYVHSYASESPIHYCDPAAVYSDDNSQEPGQDPQPPTIRCSTSSQSNLDVLLAEGAAEEVYEEQEEEGFEQEEEASGSSGTQRLQAPACTSSAAGASFNHQLTADMCNYKNSKSRRLEYSLKCLKYGRSNPSQDSAFGSLTDNDLSIGSSSIRLSSFQSISSPIDEGVEDVIIATTTGGNETCLELATIPRSMVSQDSAISSPCRESSPNNFLHIDDAMSGTGSTSSGSNCGSFGNIRPQQFPVSLSPKILVTATSNSSNSSLASSSNAGQGQAQGHGQGHPQQQFDPPKILVNDQNSIYTTSPSKRSGMIEVFSQKYRCPFQVSSFEDMSPKRTSDKQHLKHVNRLAFRSLEEERRIDNAFLPMADRTHSDNRVNMQSEKYKKLTHASFRISKGQGQDSPTATPTSQTSPGQPGNCIEMQRTGRQTLWRDSKFYRKNRIAKSNDSLMENNPSPRISPCSLRDNQYESRSSSQASRRSLSGSQQMLSVTTSFCGNGSASRNSARYCSSKSEDLGESSDYLRIMDARKSYSERHLVRLKQTAINNTHSEDDMSFNDDNNQTVSSQGQGLRQCGIQYNQKEHHQKHYQGGRWSSSCSIGGHLKTTNIKTTSLSAQSSQSNLVATSATASYRTPSKSLDQSIATIAIPSIRATTQNNTAQNSTTKGSSTNSSDSSSSTTSSVDESPSRHTLSGADLSRIFVMDMDDAPGSTCSEEKTPLLDSVEMSPMSPTDPEEPDLDKL
ncbi:serine-rich adhesin for platelets isoform X5 [Drosophila mauritiana]|uniref:Serine-rich adhesin for platelets isoform X5 n=1 Tax=Drosophila mauritiana TaxID=7226 RepID=A0A6P8K4F1_DROMA|nr:serine-rich adhesin for platelets isoform X5 [Drosophila mauritiana]